MTVDSELFRRAMRAWTTGVAVLMATHEGEEYGITVNSFSSLSADPPLVAVVLKNGTRIFELATRSRAFRVTVLAASQQEVAERFAGKLHGAERMMDSAVHTLASGAPVNGLAWLSCRVVHTYAAGENTLLIADVVEARVRTLDEPLVYHNRNYHQLKPSS